MQDVCITDILDWYLVYFLLTATIDNISGQGATERVLLMMVGMETSNIIHKIRSVLKVLSSLMSPDPWLLWSITPSPSSWLWPWHPGASWWWPSMNHEYHTNISRDRVDDTWEPVSAISSQESLLSEHHCAWEAGAAHCAKIWLQFRWNHLESHRAIQTNILPVTRSPPDKTLQWSIPGERLRLWGTVWKEEARP